MSRCRAVPAGTHEFHSAAANGIDAFLVGAFFSRSDIPSFPPNDTAIHTGTFAAGQQTIFLEATLANVTPGSNYTLSLQRPSGTLTPPISRSDRNQEEFLTIQWGDQCPTARRRTVEGTPRR